MGCNIFHNSFNCKIDGTLQKKILVYRGIFALFYCSNMRINIGIGGNKKQRVSLLFCFQFAK